MWLSVNRDVIQALHALLNLQTKCLPKNDWANGYVDIAVQQEYGAVTWGCAVINTYAADERRDDRVLGTETETRIRAAR